MINMTLLSLGILYSMSRPRPLPRSLDRHRLGEVTREINVQALHDGEPVGDQLQRDDVENALQDVDRLGDLDLLGLASLELFVLFVADDDGLATASNN